MKGRIPVFFNGEITQGEIHEAMRVAGLHLHIEAGVRLVVDRVPGVLRKDPPTTNVVRLPVRRKANLRST